MDHSYLPLDRARNGHTWLSFPLTLVHAPSTYRPRTDGRRIGSRAPPRYAPGMGFVIGVLPAADIDRLEALWRELLSHHLRDAPHLAALGTARAPEDSWRVRRRQYL